MKSLYRVKNSKARCGYCSKILSIAGGSFGNLNCRIRTVNSAILISKDTVNSDENFVDDPTNHGIFDKLFFNFIFLSSI